MEQWPIHITDLVLLAVLLISGLLAFSRGLVREVLSIAGWVGAAIITLELYPRARPFVAPYVGDPLLADLIAAGVIFVISLVMLWLLSSAISRRVQESDIGALDRSLGFLFGLLRGGVVISLAYLILIQFVPPAEHPSWLREARAMPVVRYGARVIVRLTPEQVREGLATVEDVGRAAGRKVDKAVEAGRAAESLRRELEAPDTGANTGYTSEERRQMERLERVTREGSNN